MAGEVTKLTTNLEALDKQLSAAKASHASRVAELSADLQRAQSEAQAQAGEIERFRALLKSEHVDADNMHAAVANMRVELQQKCVLMHDPCHAAVHNRPHVTQRAAACREKLLKGESATSSAALSQLESELSTSKRAAAQSSGKLGHLEAALAAEKAKRAASEERCAEVEASLLVRGPSTAETTAHHNVRSAQHSAGRVQALTGERDQLVADLRGARGADSGGEQRGVQVAALQRRTDESCAEVKALQQMLATAAAEIDTLQQAVRSRHSRRDPRTRL